MAGRPWNDQTRDTNLEPVGYAVAKMAALHAFDTTYDPTCRSGC